MLVRHGQCSKFLTLVVLVVCWFSLSTGIARATDANALLLQTAYWQDDTSQATLQQAQLQTYTVYYGSLNKGYTSAVYWVRLSLAASESPIGVQISPSWLDQITLYDSAQPNITMSAGDSHPAGVSQVLGQSLGYTFELPAASKPRLAWVKLRTTSINRMDVQVYPINQLYINNAKDMVWASLYCGVLIFLWLFLASVWWARRDKVLGAYLIRHAVFTYYATSYFGLTYIVLPSSLLQTSFHHISYSLSVMACLPMVLWFDILLLATYKPNRYLLLTAKIVGFSSILLFTLYFSGQDALALELNVVGLILATLLVFFTALTVQADVQTDKIVPKKVLVSMYSLIMGTMFVGLMGVMDWVKLPNWTVHLPIIQGLIWSVVWVLVLYVRESRQLRDRELTKEQLVKAQLDIEHEQRQRAEQSQFLHMLVHELKTPMSVVALTFGSKQPHEKNIIQARRAIHDMNAIVERCLQVDQMGSSTVQLNKSWVDLPALLHELGLSIPMFDNRFRLESDQSHPRIYTDLQLLKIVLLNLLDNAYRYSATDSVVRVVLENTQSTGSSGFSVRVINIPGKAGWPDPQQVFSKYYRSNRAKFVSGSGLGLHLAHQLSVTLGGSLHYQAGHDTVEFVLHLPA